MDSTTTIQLVILIGLWGIFTGGMSHVDEKWLKWGIVCGMAIIMLLILKGLTLWQPQS